MNWNKVENNWKSVQGEFKNKFNKLTDSDLENCKGDRQKLQSAIEKRYDLDGSEAERRVEKFIGGLKSKM